jgi:UDP-N-acetylmuramate dehydrogenase
MMAARTELRGALRCAEPMSRHTTWRVGGPARTWYRPADLADLACFLVSLPADEPIYWVGLGSNLLVRDGGIDGTVISLQGALDGLQRSGDRQVLAGAGVTCAKLARQCSRWNLQGADFFAGIPGTVGGALAMNAGAFGGETWRHVVHVTLMGRDGRLHQHSAQAFEVGYRSVKAPLPKAWFVEALLEFEPTVDAQAQQQIRTLLARRAATQPLGMPSCGSVFRNPPGDHAARLIETCGLKGHRIGGAQVSERHANFILNTGGATAAEIEALIEHVQQRVAQVHGIRLEPEVRIIGQEKTCE